VNTAVSLSRLTDAQVRHLLGEGGTLHPSGGAVFSPLLWSVASAIA
jgi:hypothetical protein